MQKRRIVHILPSLGLGGTEKVGQLIACGLDPAAFEVAVYSPTDGPRGAFIRAAGIPVIIHEGMTPFVRAFAPDILHIHRGGWPDPKLMRQIRGVLRFAPDGSRSTRIVETNVFGRFDASNAARLIDCTVFVSHFCARRYGAAHNVDISLPRYTTIYNPVETDFLAAHTRNPQQRDYSLPVVGRLSRADKGKWSALAMDMLPPLLERVPTVRYAIVGGIDSARDFVRERGLEGSVDFLPPVENLPQLAHFLDGLSVFAHANDTGESFGLVIAEAMAVGLPVVTHPSPLPKDNAQVELVEHGVTGLVAQTATEYADAVAWLLRHPEEARRMGRAGQAKAKAHYSVAVVVPQWEGLYAMLCPEPSASQPSRALAPVHGYPPAYPHIRPEGPSVSAVQPCSAPRPASFISPMVQAYSEQVLQWQLGAESTTPLPVEDPTRAQQSAARAIANALRAGHSHVLLLGLGDGSMAQLLRQDLPKACTLLVLEDQPAVARVALARSPELRPHVLVDTSPWALFLLCQSLRVPRDHCSLCFNPAYPRKQGKLEQQPTGLPVLEQWRRLFLGAQPISLPSLCTSAKPPAPANSEGQPRLSVACIAHPDESLLSEFFGHIPPWVQEVVVVWDGQSPLHLPPCAVPIRQTVRPLNGDFAAQRNAMLEVCTGDWCLYLDVDERLDAATWAAIPSWLALPTIGPEAVGAIVLPRLTFMGDADHVRVAYGLWPDVQMRLFPLREGLHFVGRVHEKLTGIQGATILVGGHGIWHYSHIRKDAEALQERLQVFNAAAHLAEAAKVDCAELEEKGGAQGEAPVQHVLSAAYPRLPIAYVTDIQGAWRLPL